MSDHDTYLQLLFTAAANLYGEITMHELWDIYLQLKEKGMAREKIHKKDILAFAAEKKIENTVYDFFEEDELYTEEERNPDRLRVVNKAIMKEGDCVATRVLIELNVDIPKIYNEIAKVINEEENDKEIGKENIFPHIVPALARAEELVR